MFQGVEASGRVARPCRNDDGLPQKGVPPTRLTLGFPRACLLMQVKSGGWCCTACARNCPTQCISGERKKAHVIDQSRCIKCGQCYEICRFDAVERV